MIEMTYIILTIGMCQSYIQLFMVLNGIDVCSFGLMVLTYTSYWLYFFCYGLLWQIVAAKLIDDYIYNSGLYIHNIYIYIHFAYHMIQLLMALYTPFFFTKPGRQWLRPSIRCRVAWGWKPWDFYRFYLQTSRLQPDIGNSGTLKNW